MMRRLLIAVLTFLIATTLAAHPGAAIAVGEGGEIYFVDTGGGVFVVDNRGVVRREPGPAFHWFAFDPAARFANTSWPQIPGAEFRSAGRLVLSSDFPVAITTDGNFNYPEHGSDGRMRIITITPGGARSVRATLPGTLRWLNGMAAGPNNTIYYTEDAAVRRVDARGNVSTIADRVSVRGCTNIPSDDPPPRPYLRSLAVGSDGTVFVAASGCAALLRIKGGQVMVVLRTAAPWSPTAVAKSGDDLYVLEYLHTASDDRREWLPRVRRIHPNGRTTIVAAVRSR